MKTFLALMTPSEIAAAARRGAIVLVPIGTVDAQGPHMPLGYDYLIAEELARRTCELTHDIWMPPVCYGVSEALINFAGTISITVDTLRDLVKSIVGSLIQHGFDHVVLITNHNPNILAIEQACRDIRRQTGILVPSAMPSVIAQDVAQQVLHMDPSAGGHGANPHASLMRFMFPEDFRLDLAATTPMKTLGPYQILSPFAIKYEGTSVNIFLDLEDLSDSGSWGDATSANAELGETVLNSMVRFLVSFVQSFKSFDVRTASHVGRQGLRSQDDLQRQDLL